MTACIPPLSPTTFSSKMKSNTREVKNHTLPGITNALDMVAIRPLK